MAVCGGSLVTAVHCLPQTAGMWRRSGSLQRERSQSSRKRNQQQQSGGQPLHKFS
jgi:hypothetical protein